MFSFGIVLYEVLARRRLFRGKTPQETLALVRAAKVPELDVQQLGVPEELRAVVARALARDLDERYETTGEIGEALTRILFEMGENVGERELADAMNRMFPPGEVRDPNKLRVDLLLRANEDATSIVASFDEAPSASLELPRSSSEPGERTSHAIPISRRIATERRRVALLVADAGTVDERVFNHAARALGGSVLPLTGSLRVAAFGHGATGERAAELAGRAGLEARRRAHLEQASAPASAPRAGPMAVVGAEALVYGGQAVDPSDEALAKAQALLAHGGEREVVVDPTLAEELARTFRLGTSVESTAMVLEGYRARREREVAALRIHGPLVGRRRELEGLSRALVSAAEGRSVVVTLLGEAGMGKTRVLAELRQLATAQDVHFVSGRCDEADVGRGYAPIADLFHDLCGIEPEDTPAERFAKVERLRVLGLTQRQVRRVGELLGIEYPLPDAARPGRARSIELLLATQSAIRALARDRAVVLALEDAHWMDDCTRELVPLLVRGLSSARVLVVITARPRATLPTMPSEQCVLPALEQAAACKLAASCLGAQELDDEARALLAREAGGNPLFVELVAAALRERRLVTVDHGVARLRPDARVDVPPAARALVAAQLGQLAPDDASLLRVAAVFEVDAPIELAQLATVAQLPVDVTEPAVRRLLDCGLLSPAEGDWARVGAPGRWGGGRRESPLPDRIRVAGGLVRRAILETLPETDVRRLHGRVLAVLERMRVSSDEHLELLAHHASRAADRRSAPEHLVQAAERASARGRSAVASRHYFEAARLLHEDGDDPRGERAVDAAIKGTELALESRAPADADRILALLASTPSAHEDPEVQLRLALGLARLAMRAGAAKDARAALEPIAAGGLAAVGDALLRGRALLELGLAQLEGGALPASLETLQRAAEQLASAESGVLHGTALSSLASALARAGRIEEAQRVASAALAVAARHGDSELRFASLGATAEVHEAQGELEAAAARYQEAGQVAHANGRSFLAARMAIRAAFASIDAGNEARAALLAEDALDLGRRHSDFASAALASAVLAALASLEAPISGAAEEAEDRALAAVLEEVESLGRYADTARTLRLFSKVCRTRGARESAERYLRRALAVANAGGYAALASRIAADAGAPSP